MDELARAYVTLGVTPGASLSDVRKRYKALVRQWHPDRFTRDPQGQAEATLRMRAINDAFRTVVAARAVPPAEPPGQPSAAYPPSSAFSGRRLTREEIDRMVEAMKNDGPLDWLMGDAWSLRLGEPVPRALAAFVGAFTVGVVAVMIGEASGASPVTLRWVMLVALVIGFAVLVRVLPRE